MHFILNTLASLVHLFELRGFVVSTDNEISVHKILLKDYRKLENRNHGNMILRKSFLLPDVRFLLNAAFCRDLMATGSLYNDAAVERMQFLLLYTSSLLHAAEFSSSFWSFFSTSCAIV